MLTPKTSFAETHGEDHGEDAEEYDEGKRNDQPYPLQAGEAPPAEAGHEDGIDRSRLENDHRGDEAGREEHEEEPPEAGDRLGGVFGLEVGIP